MTEQVDFTAIEKFVGDNKEAQATIFQAFLDSCPEIRSDIMAAVNADDADMVHQHAHKLKSSARSVGANALADLCLNLENAGKDENWDIIKQLAPAVNAEASEACSLIKQHIES